MEQNILDNKLAEIDGLIKRKQFIVSEQRARDFIKVLKPAIPTQYEAYIKALLLLSDSLTKNVKNLKALEELEKAYEQYPFEKRILNEIFELANKLKRFPRAESVLKTLINLNPADLEIRFKLINFYIERDENLNALFELNNFISFELYEPGIHKLYAACLEKEGLFAEQLEQIKLLQKIEPENSKLILEEVRIMVKMYNYSDAFNLINNFMNYKQENNLIDHEFIDSLSGFANLYIILGYKELLAELYIKTLVGHFQKLATDLKIKMEKFAKEQKFDLIFNFFAKNKIVIKYDNFAENDLLENICILLQNKVNYNISEFSLKDYLKKAEIKKVLSKNLNPFVVSLLEIEREYAK